MALALSRDGAISVDPLPGRSTVAHRAELAWRCDAYRSDHTTLLDWNGFQSGPTIGLGRRRSSNHFSVACWRVAIVSGSQRNFRTSRDDADADLIGRADSVCGPLFRSRPAVNLSVDTLGGDTCRGSPIYRR